MPELDDIELLAQYARDNSEAAFAALVTRHVNMVYSTALRSAGNPHAAEEITQAVFIILARKARSLSPRTVLSGWLYQTARLTAANFLRAEIRRQHREQEAYMQSLLNEPEPNVWPQIAPLLDAAMAGLGEKDRNAVVLRFFENKSLGEVGKALGASEDAAKMRVNRALEKLRKFFCKRGIVFPAVLIAGAVSANSVHAAPAGLAISVTATAAKGSAAAASTLTLVKGALKLMAWTKLKTAAVTGAVVLLTAGTGIVAVKTVHAVRAVSAPDIQGAWEGTVEVPQANVKLRVVFNLAKTNHISYVATLDSIDEGIKGVSVTKVAYDYPSVHIETKAIGGTFDGSLDTNTSTMSGTWKQATLNIPLVLKRTDQPATVAVPLSEGEYAQRPGSDVQGLWKGTLTVNGVSLRLNFKISEQPAGTFSARVDSVDQGANNMAASSVSYQKRVLKVELAALDGVFEGSVGAGNGEIAGTWSQAGQKWPLTLKRGDTTQDAMKESERSYHHTSENEPQGHWKGALDVNGAKLRLVLNIGKLPDGKFACDLISVDQGGVEIPATSINWTEPNLRVEWKIFAGAFIGKLQNGKLAGTWRQGGGAFPLVLERNGAN